MGVIPGGSCLGENYPGGSYPGGHCPRTALYVRFWGLKVSNLNNKYFASKCMRSVLYFLYILPFVTLKVAIFLFTS